MRIALVSTFPPARCGIANYSANLIRALAATQDPDPVDLTVLAERTSAVEEGVHEPGPARVIRCWDRRSDWVADVLARVEALAPDVVHLQHEEAILGQDRHLPALLRRLRERGVATAVTLHSVYDGHIGWLPGRWSPLRYQRALGQLADRLIVHQRTGCQDRLIAQGVPRDKIAIIAHGTEELHLVSRAQARAAVGYEDDTPMVLFLGFIHAKKGLHTLVRAFARVADQLPKARLLVAGSLRQSTVIDRPYNAWLGRHMERGAAAGWLDFRPGFQTMEQMLAYLVAADVLALPYRQRYGSASGILHMALAAGKPVICARGYKFAEAIEAWSSEVPDIFPEPSAIGQWADALVRALGDSDLRSRLADLSRDLGERTRWPVIAREHLDAYRQARAARA